LSCAVGVVAAAVLCAAPASAATHKTFRFFSKATSSTAFDAAGNPVTDQAGPPAAGFSFYATDNDYRGNHSKHAKKVFATDHIHCTVIAADAATNALNALCDAQLALPGGMVLLDHQTVNLAPDRTVFPITGGTGKYAGAKGTVTSISLGEQSDDSDLVLSVTY